MKISFKKRITSLLILSSFMLAQTPILPAMATAPGTVVINEVAWAGSNSSSNDEWIELYNTTNQTIDLTGWQIADDGAASVYQLNGTIPAHGYYLIEDSEIAVNPLAASAIINLSLANTGDSLQLLDNNSQVVDTVNSAGALWFAGNANTKASMERINSLATGDDATNWGTSTGGGSTAVDSGGAIIIGTPGLANSPSGSPGGGGAQTTVSFLPSSATPQIGSTLDVTVNIIGAQNLFSYGFEIDYDPNVLSYQTVTQGSFLNQNGNVNTFFQQGKQNGQEGTLLIAEAITNLQKNGVNGDGTLCTITFNVIGQSANPSPISFDSNSFVATPNADIVSNFSDTSVSTSTVTAPIQNLQITQDAQRYALHLTWTAPAGGVTNYKVYRKDPANNWEFISDVNTNNFIDSDALINAGDIIPFHAYDYRIVAVKNGIESSPADGSGQETRGIKGDNDRSDRVDGRDLDNLAKHFGEDKTVPNFNALIDTTYDGLIDGSDLIDLGANFALTYSS